MADRDAFVGPVEPDGPAVRLYESLGFVPCDRVARLVKTRP